MYRKATYKLLNLIAYPIRIPQANKASQRKFSHKKIIHPTKCELKIINVVLLDMVMHRF